MAPTAPISAASSAASTPPAILRHSLLISFQQLVRGPSLPLERAAVTAAAALFRLPATLLRGALSSAKRPAAGEDRITAGNECCLAQAARWERTLGVPRADGTDPDAIELQLPPYPPPPPPPSLATKRRVCKHLLYTHAMKVARSPATLFGLLVALPCLWAALLLRAAARRMGTALRCALSPAPRPAPT
eukprot:TRINITY_DN7042_c0_g1_i1.p1 TRINITY_DN7042_c0_g1~~TRINITY_DN7042_c0_g1_i1.p1  ORF type:complete len:189 (-),score=31.53 TRINITY_DN7042_c0_g1_i1:22-588(-)